ncbi:MAG: N-acetyltransferase [Phycisphaerae bacterium]|nr:N-acetyltransferase [Phycisphaerae bacterium]
MSESAFVHPTAVVDEGAKIGAGTHVWHFCHIMSGAVIGERCNLGQNVFIGNGARLGNNVRLQNNVSVYDGVEIEDDVFCGPSMVFTNDLYPRTNEARRHAFVPTPTRVCRGASIGANATLICGITIGEYALIGAGAAVSRDLPAYALAVGVPARIMGWVSRYGERLQFGSDNEAVCPVTRERYQRIGKDQIELIRSWAHTDGMVSPGVKLASFGAWEGRGEGRLQDLGSER